MKNKCNIFDLFYFYFFFSFFIYFIFLFLLSVVLSFWLRLQKRNLIKVVSSYQLRKLCMKKKYVIACIIQICIWNKKEEKKTSFHYIFIPLYGTFLWQLQHILHTKIDTDSELGLLPRCNDKQDSNMMRASSILAGDTRSESIHIRSNNPKLLSKCDKSIDNVTNLWFGSARGVMVIVVGNGHDDSSSNPGRDWLYFT